jgi:hypothetical protein
MTVPQFGSARLDYNGAFRNLSSEVTVKVGDYLDEDGNYFVTEKKQHFTNSSSPLRKAFTPEISMPLQALEGFDVNQIISGKTVNMNVSFGGSTYSVVGGFVTSDGVEINSGNGEVSGLMVTGGKFRKITA